MGTGRLGPLRGATDASIVTPFQDGGEQTHAFDQPKRFATSLHER